MSFYLDTSVLVAAITAEPGTDKAQRWLAECYPAPLIVSAWAVTELHSALSRKVRSGRLNLEHRATALALFSRMLDESLGAIAVEERHFVRATFFVEHHETGLRAGDALHLALSSDHGLTLCTFDRTLATAGESLGAPTLLL